MQKRHFGLERTFRASRVHQLTFVLYLLFQYIWQKFYKLLDFHPHQHRSKQCRQSHDFETAS